MKALDLEGDGCLLCLRAPIEVILERTREIYDDLEEAHRVGVRAAELIREAYLKAPTEMCGKSPKTLMAGAIYLVGLLEGNKRSQRDVAAVCGCTEPALRQRYRHLAEILGLTQRIIELWDPCKELRKR